jgi:hydrogenase maturation protease
MADLCEQLRGILQGRVCLVGVGNVECGDDGLGVRLAENVGRTSRLSMEVIGQARAVRDSDSLPPPHPDSLPQGEGTVDPAPSQPQRPGLIPVLRPFLALRKAEGRREGDAGLEVIVAGTEPECHLGRLACGTFDTVIFLDAVAFGADPGSVVLLGSKEMTSRFPQVSTHKISLGLLAHQVEAGGQTKAWMLGVQPQSLHKAEGLTLPVQRTLDLLTDLLSELLGVAPASGGSFAASHREPPVSEDEPGTMFVGETPTRTRGTRVLPDSVGA